MEDQVDSHLLLSSANVLCLLESSQYLAIIALKYLISVTNMTLHFINNFLFAFLVYSFMIHGVLSSTGIFPAIYNIANSQPVQTQPAQSSCGVPTRSAFCRSSEQRASVNICEQLFCMQECPTRASLPEYLNVIGFTDIPECSTKDYVNIRSSGAEHHTDTQTYGVLFAGGTATCVISSLASSKIGPNGSFTLVFWVWLAEDERLVPTPSFHYLFYYSAVTKTILEFACDGV